MEQVGELIKEAKRDWEERHKDDEEETDMMLPLIRLKVRLSRPGRTLAHARSKPRERRRCPILFDSDRTSSGVSQIRETSCNTTAGSRPPKEVGQAHAVEHLH
jgi:hypothetical protein